MDTVNTMEHRSGADKSPGILYPLMLIAAITVIVFSVAGIATMMGWLPSVESKTEPAVKTPPAVKSSTSRPRVTSSAASACGDCGVVESIRAVETKGKGSGLGAIGGAVVGGLLGNQVGRGDGRTAATVVGAGAGAFAGNEIEKNSNKSVSYQVRVRMSDGSIRTFHEQGQPALAIGQKVRVGERGIVTAG